ncbi:MAG: hypothetical protein SW019_05870 [Actinomycetota bacterium]|nr:hypothetical protein [Actinomycetota bacterium]
MDDGAGRDPDPETPELTPELLADLQAGLLDDATAARVRRRARSDPEAARILARLDAVRADLARLGADPGSAPEVPAEVTARVSAALREAPAGASGHAGHALTRPALTRNQRIAVLVGLVAAAAAVVVGAVALAHDPGPMFPAGPTASQITAPEAGQRDFPLPEAELRALLTADPDLGPLADAQRLASCLTGLGHPPNQDVLGARPLDLGGRPAVVLVLPAETPQRATAVLVEPGCSAAHTGLLARTRLDRG